MEQETITGSLIHKAHELVGENISAGDVVIDATLGNGNDALFLAQRVGEAGRLIGFDIQRMAIEKTQARLLEKGVLEEIFQLYCLSHDQMKEKVDRPVNAVMFNLGYLPGADKCLITQPQTTLSALDQAYNLLTPEGVLSVMCYPGHEGGDTESIRVMKWFLDKKKNYQLQVRHIIRENATESSPFLLTLIQK